MQARHAVATGLVAMIYSGFASRSAAYLLLYVGLDALAVLSWL